MSYELAYIIIGGLFVFAQGVTVAIIAGLFSRENKKRAAQSAEVEKKRAEESAKIEKRANIRAEESRLAMRLMSANTSLACATGMALKEGRTNGKMDIALAEAGKAQADYFKFINNIASEQMVVD